jgi:hypothetical protein
MLSITTTSSVHPGYPSVAAPIGAGMKVQVVGEVSNDVITITSIAPIPATPLARIAALIVVGSDYA